MTRHLTTLPPLLRYGAAGLLLAGYWLLAGCALVPELSRQNPGGYDGGKSDSWTGQKPKPYPSSLLTPPALPIASVKKALIAESVSYDAMAPVSYPPMSAVITPNLPPMPPLHWENDTATVVSAIP